MRFLDFDMKQTLKGDLKGQDLSIVCGLLEQELEDKQFFNPSDREVVKGVLMGFILQRELRDAIRTQDTIAVRIAHYYMTYD
jgi:hypothetical protein